MEEEKKKKTGPKAKAKDNGQVKSNVKKSSANEGKITSTKKKTGNNSTKTTTKKTTGGSKKKSTTVKKNTSTTRKTTPVKKTKVELEKNEGEEDKKITQTSLSEEVDLKESILDQYVIAEEVVEDQDIEESKSIEIQEDEIEESHEIRKVPFTNYIVAAIIVVWILIILALGFQLYNKYQEKLYDEGYFYHENINIKKTSVEGIQKVIQESPEEILFVFLNQIGEKANYELEKNLYSIMKEYGIQDNFYYIDVTKENDLLNCNPNCLLYNSLGTTLIKNIPAVVYIKDRQVVDVAQREDKKVLEAADFVKLLDMYEFKK